MNILFVHQNFPAQFGHIARRLARAKGWTCQFVSKTPAGLVDGIKKIQYRTTGGATTSNHYCSRTFENGIWHADGVFQACRDHIEVRPDLIVGHSGFGSTLFLPELYPDVPVINYFEYYYHSRDSDIDFRPEFPPKPIDLLRSRARNAMVLLDLANCRKGYSPTLFQRSLFPAEFQPKIEVIFDGIDTLLYRRRDDIPRRVGGKEIPRGTRVVTYVSRGFESLRGFDMFMRVAKELCRRVPDVLFAVVGSDRICYGGDAQHIRHKTFREHVLAQDDYDLSRFLFTGPVPEEELVGIFNLSDLHLYFTAPFVLSWSLMDALACGCTVLASDTAPVREMINHGENGLLADFFDVERFASMAAEVLNDPSAFRHVGEEAERRIREMYSLDVTAPRLARLFEEVAGQGGDSRESG